MSFSPALDASKVKITLPMKKTTLTERLSSRAARIRHHAARSRVVRVLGGRGAMTVIVGAALSIGGLSESFSGVHFLVEKKLGAVEVVRHRGDEQKVVARLEDGFAGNTIFKLSGALPDRYVSRQLSLFDENTWIPELGSVAAEVQQVAQNVQRGGEVFHTEMKRINDAIRREFFPTDREKIRRDYFRTKVPFGTLIHDTAEKHDVDPALVAALIEQESRFKSRARSHVGAKGLMQLMPRTGAWMGARDLYDPKQNVEAGVKYMKYLDRKYKGNTKLILAAYNGGEGNVARYGGIPPFRETRQYVKKVMKNYDRRTTELKTFEKQQIEKVAASGRLNDDAVAAK